MARFSTSNWLAACLIVSGLGMILFSLNSHAHPNQHPDSYDNRSSISIRVDNRDHNAYHRHNYNHRHDHSRQNKRAGFGISTYSINNRSGLNHRSGLNNRSGLARTYFTYEYDRRRARNLLRNQIREQHRHGHRGDYNDCPDHQYDH